MKTHSLLIVFALLATACAAPAQTPTPTAPPLGIQSTPTAITLSPVEYYKRVTLTEETPIYNIPNAYYNTWLEFTMVSVNGRNGDDVCQVNMRTNVSEGVDTNPTGGFRTTAPFSYEGLVDGNVKIWTGMFICHLNQRTIDVMFTLDNK